MRKSMLMMTVAAVLVSGAALAQGAPPAGGGGAGRGARMTQEERAMISIDQKGFTEAQIADARAKQQAMSPEDRAKYTADLDARWAKVSATDQAAAIAALPAGRGGAGGGAGGGAAP